MRARRTVGSISNQTQTWVATRPNCIGVRLRATPWHKAIHNFIVLTDGILESIIKLNV